MSSDSAPKAPAEVEALARAANKDLHRLIIVRPNDGTSYLDSIFAFVDQEMPTELADWEQQVDCWCDEYRQACGECAVVEVNLGSSIYVFDRTFERVIVAYGIATTPTNDRDSNRMRRFPDVNVGIEIHLADRAFAADRGHFLSHAAGGELDINLFPHRRELNRGWSTEGKRFRRMEEYVARRAGVFHAHRAVYDDDTWIPASLEYRVLMEDHSWWIEKFANK